MGSQSPAGSHANPSRTRWPLANMTSRRRQNLSKNFFWRGHRRRQRRWNFPSRAQQPRHANGLRRLRTKRCNCLHERPGASKTETTTGLVLSEPLLCAASLRVWRPGPSLCLLSFVEIRCGFGWGGSRHDGKRIHPATTDELAIFETFTTRVTCVQPVWQLNCDGFCSVREWQGDD